MTKVYRMWHYTCIVTRDAEAHERNQKGNCACGQFLPEERLTTKALWEASCKGYIAELCTIVYELNVSYGDVTHEGYGEFTIDGMPFRDWIKAMTSE